MIFGWTAEKKKHLLCRHTELVFNYSRWSNISENWCPFISFLIFPGPESETLGPAHVVNSQLSLINSAEMNRYTEAKKIQYVYQGHRSELLLNQRVCYRLRPSIILDQTVLTNITHQASVYHYIIPHSAKPHIYAPMCFVFAVSICVKCFVASVWKKWLVFLFFYVWVFLEQNMQLMSVSNSSASFDDR